MQISIGSFSFHRLLAAGKQDIFQYIKDCKALGCTQLDPWNAHLSQVKAGDAVLHAGRNPFAAKLVAEDEDYLKGVRAASDAAGLPFGCIAVDGAHIYEPTEEARRGNRSVAYRWLDVAEMLGAVQVRIDAGGPAEMPEEAYQIIAEGYVDIIRRAGEKGIEVLVENHWGPTQVPANVVKLCESIPGLGLLFDTWNWQRDKQAEGWLTCVRFARATHFKAFVFTEEGEELTQNLGNAIKLLKRNGYDGCWGVESVPRDGDEIGGARKTIELMKRYVQGDRR